MDIGRLSALGVLNSAISFTEDPVAHNELFFKQSSSLLQRT